MATRSEKYAKQGKVVDLAKERKARAHKKKKQAPPAPSARERTEAEQAPGRFQQRGAVVLLALLLFSVLTTIIGWEYFTVREVTVEGCENMDPQQVMDLSGVRVGENIFMLDTSLVQLRLESNPLIRVMQVRRSLPDTIVLQIAERKPWALIAMIGRYAVISQDDVVLDVVETPPAGQYPLVLGMPARDYHPGERVGEPADAHAKALMTLLGALEQTGAMGYIDEINLSDLENILMLTREGITVSVGTMDKLNEKFVLLTQSMPQLQQEGYTDGTVYLTGSSLNYAPSATPTATPDATAEPDEE